MLQLSLPTPCSESWTAMTPIGAGRHCGTCQKTVVDFTQQTDAELLAYFQQASPGQTCGRFRPAQLGRPLAAHPVPPQRWQLWLAGLLVAAFTTQSCQHQTPTTGVVQPIAPQHLTPPLAAPPLMGDTIVVGDAAGAVPDSVAVAPAPPPSCALPTAVLGEPEIMGRVVPTKARRK